jgi:hypothetical protein
MPVIRPSGRGEPLATLRGQLAGLLVSELMGEGSRNGPVVFELPAEEPGRANVIVYWDAWKSLPVDGRVSVVRDAYARYAKMIESSIHYIDPSQPKSTFVPEPLTVYAITWEDLPKLDLLPYKIEPNVRGDEIDPDDVRLLMMENGAIRTPFGLQLRLPNKEIAADVHARLMEEMPGAAWSIVDSSFGPIMD